MLQHSVLCEERKIIFQKCKNGNVGRRKDNKRDREVSIFILFHIIKWLGWRNCLILMKFLFDTASNNGGNEW